MGRHPQMKKKVIWGAGQLPFPLERRKYSPDMPASRVRLPKLCLIYGKVGARYVKGNEGRRVETAVSLFTAWDQLRLLIRPVASVYLQYIIDIEYHPRCPVCRKSLSLSHCPGPPQSIPGYGTRSRKREWTTLYTSQSILPS